MIGGRPGEGDTLVLLAAWALAMGIQSVAVRQLDVSGVFTTAATATFIFLVGDVANGPVTGEELRRLLGVLLGLFIGATAGALLFVHAPSYAPVLPFVITVGVVATAAKDFDIARELPDAGLHLSCGSAEAGRADHQSEMASQPG